MTINSALRASASGLHAERLRLDTISGNIANANSMRTPTEDAYRRKMVILEPTENGVRVKQIVEDDSPLREAVEPENPYADANGIVYYSNVNPVFEMVNMMTATRSYEANIAAFNSSKSMLQAALSIGRA